MYRDSEHYLLALFTVLPLTLICYAATYLVLRQARGFVLTWPMQLVGIALAAFVSPLVLPYFYSSLAAVGKGDTFVNYFAVGFISSVIAQVSVWLIAVKALAGKSAVTESEVDVRGDDQSNSTGPWPGRLVMSQSQNSRSSMAGIWRSSSAANRSVSNALDQLERLSGLRQSGALTETEYAALKAQIIPEKDDSEEKPQTERSLHPRFQITRSVGGTFLYQGRYFSTLEKAIECAERTE